ncbi:MAG: hypothetical protein WCT19_02420 [Candidatus Paceibacterota bacterium]
MNNQFVRQRLERLTPRTLLKLANSGHISMCIVKLRVLTIKGSLGEIGHSKWLITVYRQQKHKENLLTLLHEFFHLFLFEQGLDYPMHKQTYSDKILERVALRFIRLYPHSVLCLWRQMQK